MERLPLLFDALGQGKLHLGAPEVLAGFVDLEIAITVEVIGEEAQTELETDQACRLGDEAQIRCGQH